MRTAPLAPSEQPNDDVTFYIVLNDFGQLGRAFVETDEAEADEMTVVDKILRGEYSNPVRVVAFNTAKEWSRDVTEEIALAVQELADAEGHASKPAQQFVERIARESSGAY
jgi:hypothetical protein